MMGQSAAGSNTSWRFTVLPDVLRREMPLRAKLKATVEFFILVANRNAEEKSWES